MFQNSVQLLSILMNFTAIGGEFVVRLLQSKIDVTRQTGLGETL